MIVGSTSRMWFHRDIWDVVVAWWSDGGLGSNLRCLLYFCAVLISTTNTSTSNLSLAGRDAGYGDHVPFTLNLSLLK